ncbi:AAA family ATPase [Gordonia sp. (in: high G+C Gram-positive bacteria)]|uniref:AAA family ATPase n=1 Tax=Gordonia sp. (in: high G+C Gram-positive bacteria) TaxID=84139 RepID=UPI003C7585F2
MEVDGLIPYGKDYDEDGHEVGSLLGKMFNGAWLDKQQFPQLEEIVPNVLVEGMSIIVGPPKVGKSWLVLALAIACAAGGTALGVIDVNQRPVLYLALEDGPRRLQARLRHLCQGDPLPRQLDMLCDVEPGTVEATIAEWLLLHHNQQPLVILDTLGKARPQRRGGEDPYLADYKVGSQLKRLVDDVPGSGLLVVHHTNKGDSGDFVDAVSGTQGIAGSADSILVLRRPRKSDEATLAVTGRDVIEREIALLHSDGKWQLDGFTIESAVERAEERQQKNSLGDRSMDVLKVVNTAGDIVRAADVAKAIPDIAPDQARVYLNRLADADHITKVGRGQYSAVTSVSSVTSGENLQVTLTSDDAENVTDETVVTPFRKKEAP